LSFLMLLMLWPLLLDRCTSFCLQVFPPALHPPVPPPLETCRPPSALPLSLSKEMGRTPQAHLVPPPIPLRLCPGRPRRPLSTLGMSADSTLCPACGAHIRGPPLRHARPRCCPSPCHTWPCWRSSPRRRHHTAHMSRQRSARPGRPPRLPQRRPAVHHQGSRP